ncbi:indolepyruvate oxidoreductase subunit beta family protein [Jannaschia sp. CCS1]|uniref:indolepyruvate oxidoreductase subunit beta family protein n=1 Tax=Jannaschia sp. (strain CCS1) TaxID=290400 RepID=UPI000053C6AB|nr:indolepyruvate oxidoreductase subunit beta family protein [Jannaschia sp. CCS1]ABD54250.1 indolepyruvate ferredoxin oxidoreductase beta subunit [Jannaschia sp. CCS1]
MNAPTKIKSASGEIIKLAVLAVGGQGGGVLTNWIADLATRGDYAVQMTSVAGVAQRTGATIYYLEMAPKSARAPVFALSPSPGDLDVLIAAELMEAGRSVLRGFVTPDRTTLIASNHRILSISEKMVPGDGRAEGSLVAEEITKAALNCVCFDMETLAAKEGSMISASLFGGLARSGALPFDVAPFEAVIEASGRGVTQSLAAFRAALTYAPDAAAVRTQTSPVVHGPQELLDGWGTLCARVEGFPAAAKPMTQAGLAKVVDYQDLDCGKEYLDHLEAFSFDGGLATAAAKYVANAMCYDDILRVADLKTRASRQGRLRGEQDILDGEIVHVTEYFHPRAQEVCGTLPAGLGAWIEVRPRVFSLLDRLTNKGRRIRTDGILGFGTLWAVSALKPRRRKFLRHRHERAHLERLLGIAKRAATSDIPLAIEILQCQRLIKGYADTHARGRSKFRKVIEALEQLEGRPDAADWIKRLRIAALEDEHGDALDGALATVRSFA